MLALSLTLLLQVGGDRLPPIHATIGKPGSCHTWVVEHRRKSKIALAQDRWVSARLLTISDEPGGWLRRPPFAPVQRWITDYCRNGPNLDYQSATDYAIMNVGRQELPPPPTVYFTPTRPPR